MRQGLCQITVALRMVVAFVVLGFLATACGVGGGEPEPTTTATAVPATAVPATATPTALSQAELQRLLIKISVPCRDILATGIGFYETLSESHESLTPDDIRKGLVAKYQVSCKFFDLSNDAYPRAVSLTISAFESQEEARDSVRTIEGEAGSSVYTASANPLLGDKSAASSFLDKETGKKGEVIRVALGTFAIHVFTLGAEDEELARLIAFSAAKAMSESAAAMR